MQSKKGKKKSKHACDYSRLVMGEFKFNKIGKLTNISGMYVSLIDGTEIIV